MQNLQSHIKDGILTITGLPDSIINDGDFWISDVYGKMQLVATDFIANDDSYFMEIFEKVVKEQFLEITKIVYNIIFVGKNRNTCYNKGIINTGYIFSQRYGDDECIKFSKSSLYDKLVDNPEILKLFLFGNSVIRGGYYYL